MAKNNWVIFTELKIRLRHKELRCRKHTSHHNGKYLAKICRGFEYLQMHNYFHLERKKEILLAEKKCFSNYLRNCSFFFLPSHSIITKHFLKIIRNPM